MTPGYGPDKADAEKANAFWEFVRAGAEVEEPTTVLDELTRREWIPADSVHIPDAELSSALERIVLDLSWLHVYLHATEHLPDRELYEEILQHVEQNATPFWPDDPGSAISISFLSAGGCDERETYLRYYADEKEREWWAQNYPACRMPEPELPPYPRPWIPERPDFD